MNDADVAHVRELLLESFTAGWQAALAVNITNPRVLAVVEVLLRALAPGSGRGDGGARPLVPLPAGPARAHGGCERPGAGTALRGDDPGSADVHVAAVGRRGPDQERGEAVAGSAPAHRQTRLTGQARRTSSATSSSTANALVSR